MLSRTQIWKQDPSVPELSTPRQVLIQNPVKDGPRDADIVLSGLPVVKGDSKTRDFTSWKPGTDQFDAVHTYTVVRKVIDLVKKDIIRINEPGDSGRPKPPKPVVWKWQWESQEGTMPITVYPHAGEDANAYYDREGRELKFFYFPDESTGKRTYTCRSFEIVAHETGHAVLDALRPDLWGNEDPQAGGIHEAFGDITAIFNSLAQLDVCEAVIVASKMNLHDKTFLAGMGEEMGTATGRPKGMGIRNADNDLKLSEVDEEVHEISQVLTGAIYDVIAGIFKAENNPTRYDPAETILRVANRVRLLFLAAIIFMESPTYAEIGRKMIEYEPSTDYKKLIETEFSRREIFESTTETKVRVSSTPTMLTGGQKKRKLEEDEKNNGSGKGASKKKGKKGSGKKHTRIFCAPRSSTLTSTTPTSTQDKV